jgi:SAM-dependent methyltransferase
MSLFDAYSSYYDLLYRDKDYGAESQYVIDLLRRHGVDRGAILELGCGTGRHAEHLANAGFSVHGVDLSPSMVAKARERFAAAPSAFRFDVGDIRSVRVDRVHDAVVSLFHVLSYQTSNRDLSDLFRTAETHLRSGGVFVFDFWYGPGVLADRPTVRVKELSDDSIDIVRIARPTMFPNHNCVDVDYTVLVTNKADTTVHRIEEKHRMRYLFLPEIEKLAEEHGMSLANAFGGMTEHPLGWESWTGTVVAVKK